jgi:hypothetical protein
MLPYNIPSKDIVFALLYVRGVSKTFGEWYQKINKTEDTNKLTFLAFKIIAILHITLLATFIKLLETFSKGLFSIMKSARFADVAPIQ